MSLNRYRKKPFMAKPCFKVKAIKFLFNDTLEKLRIINDTYSDTRNFSKYSRDIKELFDLPKIQITEESKRFLGGFVEGEGCLSVSAKKLKTALFGLTLDPEFSITQHVNGIITLYLALNTFQTGRIRYKQGSNATMVYLISNRESLKEKVIPFYEKYIKPFGSPTKAKRLHDFKELLRLLEEGKHKNFTDFRDKLLPIWDGMRVQVGQSNQTFTNLEEAQDYISEFYRTL